MNTMTHDQSVSLVRKVERTFKDRLEALSIKPKSAKGLSEQAAFLSGAMAAINAIAPNANPERLSEFCPPRWVVTIMTGRSVLDFERYDPPAPGVTVGDWAASAKG